MAFKHRFLYLAITILWILYFFTLKKLLEDISPFFFNFIYQIIIALILFLVVPRINMPISKLIIFSFFWGIIYQGSLITFIWLGTEYNYNIIYNYIIFYIPLMVILKKFLGSKSNSQILAISISYIGIIISASELGVSFDISSSFLILAAFGAVISKHLLMGTQENPMTLLCYISFISALMSLIISYLFENPDFLNLMGNLPISSLVLIITAVIFNISISGSWIYLISFKTNDTPTFALLAPFLGALMLSFSDEGFIVTPAFVIGIIINFIGIILYLHYRNGHKDILS